MSNREDLLRKLKALSERGVGGESINATEYENTGDTPEEVKKYRHAVLVLQAIAQRSGGYKNGGYDEWSEASAFIDCKRAAVRCLKYIGEPTTMPNRKNKPKE